MRKSLRTRILKRLGCGYGGSEDGDEGKDSEGELKYWIIYLELTW